MIHFKVFKLNYKLIALSCIIVFILSYVFINHFVKAEENSCIKVPIIMYHSILKSQSGNYIIHPETFESDLKYIQNHGYTTITMTDLINYVYEDSPLPEKPIIITFDDGYYNNIGYALPLLQKYNMKAVISIVGDYTDTYTNSNEANLNYSYIRWKDIKSLIDEGTIEFQNHTYNLHKNANGRKGCMKKNYESLEDYENLLSSDVMKLQKEFETNTNYIPNTFTYPFGAISKDSTKIIKELGFKASLSCTSGVNLISKDPECLYLLKRNNRISGISSEQFFKKIDFVK